MLIKNFVDKVYCINLKSRQDKKKNMRDQMKKLFTPVTFFQAVKNKKNPARGCLESHMRIIKEAKEKKYEIIMIMEDDCIFNVNKLEIDIETLPADWEMLYLGGNVQKLYDENDLSIKNKTWIKMACHAAHCYIIRKEFYDFILTGLNEYKNPIDVFYSDDAHARKNSYILNPFIAVQQDGYSDIEGKHVKYHLHEYEDFLDMNQVDMEYNEETHDCLLKLKNEYSDDDLPYVSILTPTKNRKHLFQLAIYSFQHINYPPEKLEWVIVDDSNNGQWLSDILPDDNRIKYVKLNTNSTISIGHKRNLCVKYATHNYLCNMDDDDYYLPNTLITRMKVMLDNPKCNIIGCGIVTCYDIIKKRFCNVGSNKNMAEATMLYKRSFFDAKKFNPRIKTGEGMLFIRGRKEQALLIPHSYVMFVINHKGNMTGDLRIAGEDEFYLTDFYHMPKEVEELIHRIHGV